jgi:hypothetical protein
LKEAQKKKEDGEKGGHTRATQPSNGTPSNAAIVPMNTDIKIGNIIPFCYAIRTNNDALPCKPANCTLTRQIRLM